MTKIVESCPGAKEVGWPGGHSWMQLPDVLQGAMVFRCGHCPAIWITLASGQVLVAAGPPRAADLVNAAFAAAGLPLIGSESAARPNQEHVQESGQAPIGDVPALRVARAWRGFLRWWQAIGAD